MPTPPPPSGLSDLRSSLARRRAELLESIPSEARPVALDGAGIALGRRNARILDDLLCALFAGQRRGEIRGPASERPVPPPEAFDAVALAGVGSYGRGAVALKSDL